jgi:hypothetical protein
MGSKYDIPFQGWRIPVVGNPEGGLRPLEQGVWPSSSGLALIRHPVGSLPRTKAHHHTRSVSRIIAAGMVRRVSRRGVTAVSLLHAPVGALARPRHSLDSTQCKQNLARCESARDPTTTECDRS